jgi:hypothetical protein
VPVVPQLAPVVLAEHEIGEGADDEEAAHGHRRRAEPAQRAGWVRRQELINSSWRT